MQKIIQSAQISDVLKKVLAESFAALENRQENFFRELERRVEVEMMPRGVEKFFEIATALVPKKFVVTMRQRGFFEVPGGEVYFLNCSYENFLTHCAKTYFGSIGGAKFSYKLQPSDIFIDLAENLLFDVAKIYRVERPLIFSPYARRTVEIFSDEVDVKNLSPENLCLAENRLAEIFIADCALMWNVKISRREFMFDAKTDTKNYIYAEPTAENNFILPQGAEVEQVIRRENETEITCREKLPSDAYLSFEIFSAENADVEIFSNTCADVAKLLSKERLRTAGDVNFVLKCLEQKNFSAEFSAENVGAEIQRYSQLHAYAKKFQREENFNMALRKKNSPPLTVKFAGEEKFLTDWANFVLSWLEMRFPEYAWKGVV